MEASPRERRRVALPRLPEPLLRRPELERRLTDARSRRLGLVIADAGFGKTTVAASVAAGTRTAWYTLTAADRDVERLAQGLVRALRLVVPDLPDDLARALNSARGPDAVIEERERSELFAGLVCEALESSSSGELVVALDDVQELAGSGGEALVEGLCLQAGAGVHLLLSSRLEPPFPVERIRAQGQVLELTGRDLAFSVEEVAELASNMLGESGELLARRLHETTAGWPAGVRLALEALRAVPEDEQAAIIEGLGASGSPVFEYLAREGFDREAPEVRELIRRAAELDAVSPDLCAALGMAAEAGSLSTLSRRGLFFAPDPHEPGWFAVTPLARDFVRSHHPLASDEQRSLRTRAAAWLEQGGRAEAALQLLTVAGAESELARMLRQRGESLLRAGGVGSVIAAGELVSPESRDAAIEKAVGRARQISGDWEGALACFGRAAADAAELEPGLAWRMGLIHHMRGELDEAEQVYGRGRLDGPPGDVASLLAWHASLDWLRSRVDECRERATRALEVATGADDAQALACVHTVLAMLAALEGDRIANDAHYLRALEHAERAGDVLQIIRIRTNRGSRFLEEAAYAEALAEHQVALRLADAAGFAFFRALTLSNRGQTWFLLGRFEEARADLEQSRAIYDGMGSHDVAYPGAVLGDLHSERGVQPLARAAYEEALAHAEEAGDLQGLVPALAGLARLLVAEEPAEARRLAERALDCGTGMGYVQALLCASRVAQVDDPDRVAGLAREAASVARARRDRAGLAEALELEAATLEPADAEARLGEAHSIWTEIGAPLGVARVELALAASADGADAERLVAGAERTLREIGANAYAPQVAAVRSRLRDQGRPPLTILTLGRFRVLRNGDAVPLAEWQSKKARDLLKILIARRGRPTQREFLMETLWPGEDPARVANRLSVALSTARAVLRSDERSEDGSAIVADADVAALDVDQVELDVQSFLLEAEAGLALIREERPDEARERLSAAEALYAGDFLEEDAYEDWAVPLREETRATYISVVRALADDAVAGGQPELAERYLRRLLEKDRHDEGAHLTLVRALSAARRHGDARRAYRAYAARMRDIGVEPAAFPTSP
jgi:ATP/maltotriose-dependent transcriptional regulator MalT/DNA-binding winged helix-turn-helix (wHTH) protein